MTSSNDWGSGSTESTNGDPLSTATPLGDDALGHSDAGFTGAGGVTSPTAGGSFEGNSGTADTGAKDKARDAANSAAEHGADVADTAKDEAQQVIGEAKDKAADLLSEAKSQVDQQSRTQMQSLASKLGELSDELDSMVKSNDAQGTVTDLARQLSSKTRALSSQLREQEPKDLLNDVRGFARQRPGTFLLGAVAAGIFAGRLTRGAKEASSSGASGSGSGSGSTGASTPGASGAAPYTPTSQLSAGSTSPAPQHASTEFGTVGGPVEGGIR